MDDGLAAEKPHRHRVIEAIANHFLTVKAPTVLHEQFVSRLAARHEISVPVFCLNYDCMIESSADAVKIRLVDGFSGIEKRFFEPETFQHLFAVTHRGARKPQADWKMGTIHLYKLHGSLGWFQAGRNDVRCLGFGVTPLTSGKRLMVPPQHRKATETTVQPYASLWSEFRRLLCHGPSLIHRLVTIGYGYADEHVNAVIENALARSNFNLLVFARSLPIHAFAPLERKEKRSHRHKHSMFT